MHETIVYDASWQRDGYRLYRTSIGDSDSRALSDLPPADLLAVSNGDRLAISSGRQPGTGFAPDGTLAVVPLAGGLPRELFERVVAADWNASGELAAIARRSGPVARLEFPVGTTIHEAQTILSPRLSPDGRHLCFFAGYGNLLVTPPGGPARTLANGLGRASSCAWSRDSREIWVVASSEALSPDTSGGTTHTDLQAIDLSGRRRPVNPFSGFGRVMDVAPDGRLLLAMGTFYAIRPMGAHLGHRESDLSIYDATRVAQMRADGEEVLHVVEYEGVGARLVARDVATGARRTVDEIRVPDPAGVLRFDVWVARDAKAWAYSLTRRLSNLYVVDRLR